MAKPKLIRCPCLGTPGCKLCDGSGKYAYNPGPLGYMPFACPNCAGEKFLVDEDGDRLVCKTCHGQGGIDPANPPTAGMWDILTKILFGA